MNRTFRLGVFCVVLLVIAVGAVNAQTSIQIKRPMVTTPSRETEKFVDQQIMRAIELAEASGVNAVFGYDGFASRKNVRSPRIQIDLIAMESPEQSMFVFNATGPDGAAESYPYMMPWQPNMYRDLSSVLLYFHGRMTGEQTPQGKTPRYLLDFKTEFISTADTQYGDLSLVVPYGITQGPGDEVLLGAGSFIVSTDRYFREYGKRGLDLQSRGTWAWFVEGTPGGSIISASTGQPGVIRIIEGLPMPVQIPTNNPAYSFAVLDDGTSFLLDLQQNITRYRGTEQMRLELELPQGTFISFIADGPENTLWVWEPTHRAFLIFDEDGNRLDMLIPHAGQWDLTGTRFFQPYPDGSVLIATSTGFWKVDRSGRIMWQVEASEIPELGMLAFWGVTEFDPRTGIIYLANISERRIAQLLDIDYIERTRRLSSEEGRLLEINEVLRRRPNDIGAIVDRSQLYEEMEAWELSAHSWQIAAGLDPTNREAAEGRRQSEIRLLRRKARQALIQALDQLERLGPSSASVIYFSAQKMYEELIALAPDDTEARAELEQLRETYNEAATPQQQRRPLTIASAEIPDLFPSLFERYQREPVGHLVVRNTLEDDAKDIQLTVEMRFLDFAVTSPIIPTLTAGEDVSLEFKLPLSPTVLTLEEDLPTSINLSLSYTVGGVDQTISRQEIITVYRATALTWDDTRKIAAYVMPRESTVEEFALLTGRTGSEEEQIDISEKVFRAARIADAVGTFGIEYIEDPDSGISNVLGVATVVDTVRFPRYTLRRRVGDCDDTTALLCSLYEAAGMQTAIMTSPGHIFMAFNTGEPEQNAWLFESDSTAVIRHAGTVWLPVETTILDQGFTASWIEGSRLVKRYESSGDIEFLPVGELRDDFPPLPLPSDTTSFQIVPPGPDSVADLYEETFDGLIDSIYESNVSALERGLSGQSSRRKVRTLNQIGILHARFNQAGRAEDRFEEAIRTDPDNSAGYINLANLKLVGGDARGALRHLDALDRVRPDLTLASLLRAQAHFLLGDEEDVRENMRLVEEKAPELAQNYPHLTTVTGAARASEAQGGSVMPWDFEGE